MASVDNNERGGLSAAIGRITDGFSRLLSEHLALARAELSLDAHQLGRKVAGLAVFASVLLVGYAFAWAAVAAALIALMPAWAALAVVGALNLAVGGIGAYQVALRLSAGPKVLQDSRSEAQRSARTLVAAGRPVLPSPADGKEKRLGA